MPLPSPNLTDEEKVKVRHHTGFLNVQEAYTFVLGVPAGVETQFIIEGAMQRVLPAAVPFLQQLIARLDELEELLMCNVDLYEVTALGSMSINSVGKDNAQALNRRNYDMQVASLCNVLGIERNPFDKRMTTVLGSTGTRPLNMRVRG